MDNKKVFKRLFELSAVHKRIALATVVKTKGSAPREVGAKMMILPHDQFEGTVGGGCGEAEGGWQRF